MAQALPTVNLIGAGRVGQTLAHLWTRHGVLWVQDVLTRSPDSARTALDFITSDASAARPVEHLVDMRPANIWLLAVPDAQIAACAQHLAAHARQRSDSPALAFHCSGAQSAELLAPLRDLGWAVASAHPVLSFASAKAAVAQFAGTPCALEGDAAACDTLRPLFEAIGAACFGVRSQVLRARGYLRVGHGEQPNICRAHVDEVLYRAGSRRTRRDEVQRRTRAIRRAGQYILHPQHAVARPQVRQRLADPARADEVDRG